MSNKRDLRARPRWVQKLWARLWGYFWLPCPLCGNEVGGHEAWGDLYLGDGKSTSVCINCAEKAKAMSNVAHGKEIDNRREEIRELASQAIVEVNCN